MAIALSIENCPHLLWRHHFIQSCIKAHALFAGLISDWATTKGKLLYPPSLPHKDDDISLSTLPKNTTSELAGFFLHAILSC